MRALWFTCVLTVDPLRDARDVGKLADVGRGDECVCV